MPDPRILLTHTSTPEEVIAAIREHGLEPVVKAVEVELPKLIQNSLMHLHVSEVTAQQGAVALVTIDQVVVSPVGVHDVQIQNVGATLTSASAYLQGVSMVIELHLIAELWWDIPLPWPFPDIEGSASWPLPTVSFGLTVGNVAVPSLGVVQLNIPTVTLSNLEGTVSPVQGVSLGAGSFTGLTVQQATMPTDGFQIGGMSLGSVSVSGVGAPAVDCAAAKIAHFHTVQPVVLPQVTMPGITIPSTYVPNVQSGAINTTAYASEKSVGVDAGIFEVKVRVNPVIHMHVDALSMQSLSLSASTGPIVLHNVTLPVNVNGVSMSKLSLQQVQASGITVP